MALRIDRKVVLASASPSRKMLLEQAGVDFEVVVSGVDETVPPEFTPAQTVETLAQRKGEAVLALRPEMPIIAADSVVSIDGLILGKPADDQMCIRDRTWAAAPAGPSWFLTRACFTVS